MKTLRLAVSGILVLLLSLGYAGSQLSTDAQYRADWAQKVDQPPIVALSLVLFMAAVALFLIPDREGEDLAP